MSFQTSTKVFQIIRGNKMGYKHFNSVLLFYSFLSAIC